MHRLSSAQECNVLLLKDKALDAMQEGCTTAASSGCTV
jgi:hypothetical protein